MTSTFILIPDMALRRTFMMNCEGSVTAAMHKHFTDTENTGAPLVPMVEEPSNTATDGGQSRTQELEEEVYSHRLDE